MAVFSQTRHKPLTYSGGLQVLRGLAALMIVFLHLGVAEGRYGDLQGFRFLDGFKIGAAGVDIFFVISGLVMILVTWNRSASPGVFLRHRLTRIYPNYWIYFLLVTLVWLIQPNWVNSSLAGTPDFLASFFLVPTRGFPVVNVAWTLEFEIFFYLVFTGLLTLKSEGMGARIALVMAGLVLIGQTAEPQTVFLERITHPLILEFAVGAWLGSLILGKHLNWTPWTILLGVLSLVAYQLGFSVAAWLGLPDPFQRVVDFGIPAVLLVMGVISLDLKWEIHYPVLFTRLGDASYTLYLSHVLVISALGRIWQKFELNHVMPNMIFLLILLTACAGYALLAFRWIEKPLLIFLRNKLDNLTS